MPSATGPPSARPPPKESARDRITDLTATPRAASPSPRTAEAPRPRTAEAPRPADGSRATSRTRPVDNGGTSTVRPTAPRPAPGPRPVGHAGAGSGLPLGHRDGRHRGGIRG